MQARALLLWLPLWLIACAEEEPMMAPPATVIGGGGMAAVGAAGFAGQAGAVIAPPPPIAGMGMPPIGVQAGMGGGTPLPQMPNAGSGGGMPAGAGGAGSAAPADAGTAGMNAGEDGGTMPGGYQPCPPMGEACKILPLGDSITFGIGYSGGYRVELFRKAHAAGQTITFTGSVSNGPMMVDGVTFPRKNEGHSGWKIAQLNPLIPNPAFMEKPHIVLLMIGTNDIAQNDNLAAAPERLGRLIDLLIMNAPDALIVVAKVTPLSFGGGGVMTYNAALPAVVEARASAGKHVVLVDMFEGFPTSELGDGVHPNQRGYERMAGVWYEAIEDVLH